MKRTLCNCVNKTKKGNLQCLFFSAVAMLVHSKRLMIISLRRRRSSMGGCWLVNVGDVQEEQSSR